MSPSCFAQVVDDILDFTQTAEQLGKPQGQDLASGNLTAPVIYALQQSKELEEIIQSEPAGGLGSLGSLHSRWHCLLSVVLLLCFQLSAAGHPLLLFSSA